MRKKRCRFFLRADQIPSVWNYDERIYEPVRIEETDGGVLCEFETELTAQTEVLWVRHTKNVDILWNIRVFCADRGI